jgi:hypothetical protein
MFEDDDNEQSFEDTVRSIARELGSAVERAVDRVDLEEIADAIGVDPAQASEWIGSASGWLRAQTEHLGEDVAKRMSDAREQAAREWQRAGGERQRDPAPSERDVSEDPLRGAGPHPLDLPTEEQGLALSALESGRWSVEPGTETLAVHGEGPSPHNAMGIVRELRVRDWISAEGEVTVVGRHALDRWLSAGEHR